jgi:mannose-1-phosphate guanylyltransferase / mannose-6-phosphate isomerase
MNNAIIPVILCGGAGSRLWPISRELHPKPFIRLADGQSLLQKAFLLATQQPQILEVVTVSNRELYFKIEDEYREVNKKVIPLSFILEPSAKNTAASICSAAIYLSKKYGDDATMLILAADHLILDSDAFTQSIQEAIAFAKKGKLVTFGIKPHSPETGYGYIEMENNTVKSFTEKPCAIKAAEFLESGNYYWNSGIFCFEVKSILDELKKHAETIFSGILNCIENSQSIQGKSLTQIELRRDIFELLPEISIDYAVMEKSKKMAVIPCDFGWSDIGCWKMLSNLVPADDNGNRVKGEVLLQDTYNSYIESDNRLVAAIGIDNVIVIDTPDALLIANKSHSQEVKQVYSQLKNQGHASYKIHSTVHRPWGTYTVLEERAQFKIKRLVVKPGASLSLQMHYYRSEHWIVVCGIAKVTSGKGELLIHKNESTFIPAGLMHRVENPGLLELVMIEIQSGEYLGEDDIVRFEDKYGRVEEVTQ